MVYRLPQIVIFCFSQSKWTKTLCYCLSYGHYFMWSYCLDKIFSFRSLSMRPTIERPLLVILFSTVNLSNLIFCLSYFCFLWCSLQGFFGLLSHNNNLPFFILIFLCVCRPSSIIYINKQVVILISFIIFLFLKPN